MKKSSISTVSIKKSSNGSYDVIAKAGRLALRFNLQTKNAARSFVRRNFAQRGHYSA